jgi:hypothetical protein
MPAAVIGGNVRCPNLQSIADLFRAQINDTFNNTQGGDAPPTGNEAGLIMSNSNPDLVIYMDSAIQELFADLRNVGDPELIIDNYIITGIPPLTQANPTVQVSLGYMGYFNGFTWDSTRVLPSSVSKMLMMWERQTGTNNSFFPMSPAPLGLPGVMQGQRMCLWEMRQGQIWMPGCLTETDLRLRARITYPPLLYSANLNFATTYVPILDSRNAIVSKMLIRYAIRFAPEQYQMAVADEARQMGKLKLEVVRAMQNVENQRSEFGGEAVEDFAIAWSWL